MKWLFYSGSNTSNKAALGSPLWLDVNLSISSNKITGFLHLVFLIPYINDPGNAPTYVLLCPLIYASSDTPPKAIL